MIMLMSSRRIGPMSEKYLAKRRETEYELNIMNDLYRHELRQYKNFFMPNVKLIDKKRTGRHGEKIKKIYDKAKTPYQRVLECDQVNKKIKEQLREQYRQLNPAALRRTIIAKINKLNKLKINQHKIVIPTESKVTFTNHSMK